MRNFLLAATALVLGAGIMSFSPKEISSEEPALNAAMPMPDYKMKDVSGKDISLKDVKTAKGLLVIFSCNTCPYVKLSESRIKEITDLCVRQGLGCIIVNSNEAQRGDEDSYEAMVKYAKTQRLTCPYAVDANSKLADAFGATRTPQCFLFNANGNLVYKGAIDDNVKDPAAVKSHFAMDGIAAVLKSETPKVQETKSIGCTIKRME